MGDINSGVIQGRIVADAELKYTSAGTAILRFSIASNKKIKGEEQTSYFDIEKWGAGAEAIASYCYKGRKVTVEYEAKQDRWTSQADGQPRSRVVFVAREIGFDGPPREDRKD